MILITGLAVILRVGMYDIYVCVLYTNIMGASISGGHGLHWKDKVKIIDEKRRKIEMDNDKPSGNNKDMASSKTSCTVTYMFSKHS